jgi:TRAP-type mannitol/chloroaromatic compound transport system permease small subunit
MTELTSAGTAPVEGSGHAALVALVRVADGANAVVGKATAWLTLGTVLACFATVYTRYALGVNFIWLQEIYVWQHAAVIVLGAGYTMMTGGFVRVDVFYADWSARRRAIADMSMTVLLLAPFLYVFTGVVWAFFVNSWRSDEGSMNPGGLSDLWLLKFTLVVFCALVALQGLAILARGALVLSGREEWALRHGGHGADAAG